MPAEPPSAPPPAPRPPAAVAVVPPVVDHAAARAAADAFSWHLPPAAGQLEHIAGEPLRLTAAEWARLSEIEPRSGSMCRDASAALEPPSGPAVAGVATGAADLLIKSLRLRRGRRQQPGHFLLQPRQVVRNDVPDQRMVDTPIAAVAPAVADRCVAA